MMAGRNAPGAIGKTAHTCRAHTVRGRDGEGDMGQTLLTSGPSSGGVEGESKRAFAYEVLLPGNADNTLVGAFRSDLRPGDRPLGIMTIRGHNWMCLASHRIVIAVMRAMRIRRLSARRPERIVWISFGFRRQFVLRLEWLRLCWLRMRGGQRRHLCFRLVFSLEFSSRFGCEFDLLRRRFPWHGERRLRHNRLHGFRLGFDGGAGCKSCLRCRRLPWLI